MRLAVGQIPDLDGFAIGRGKLPAIGLKISDVAAAEIEGLAEYQAEWRKMAYGPR